MRLLFWSLTLLMAVASSGQKTYDQLFDEAIARDRSGDLKGAFVIFSQAKNIALKEKPVDKERVLETIQILLVIAKDLGDLQKAERVAQEWLDWHLKFELPKTFQYALISKDLALVKMNLARQNSQILGILTDAEEAIRNDFMAKPSEVAEVLNAFGLFYYYQNQNEKAEQYYEEGVGLLEKDGILEKEEPGYLQILGNLAQCKSQLGKWKDAEELFEKVLRFKKKKFGKNDPRYAITLKGLADMKQRLGEFAESEKLYLEALNIFQEAFGPNDSNLAEFQIALGEALRLQGKFLEAENYLKQAVDLRKRTMGDRHPTYGLACAKLGGLYVKMGQYLQAMAQFTIAAPLITQGYGYGHPYHLELLEASGNMSLGMMDFENAIKAFQTSLDIKTRMFGAGHPGLGVPLNGLGMTFLKQEKFEKSADSFKRALAIISQDKKSANYASILNNYALALQGLNQYEQAEPLFLEALELTRNQYGPNSPNLLNALGSVGSFYYRRKDFEEAWPYFKEALNNRIESMNLLLPTLSEEQSRNFLRTQVPFFDNVLGYLTEYLTRDPGKEVADALQFMMLHLKGRQFRRTLQPRLSENQTLFGEWKKALAELSIATQIPLEQRESQGIDEVRLRNRVASLEQQLRSSKELIPTESYQNLNIRDIKKALVQGEALVELVRSRVMNGDSFDTVYLALITKVDSRSTEVVVFNNGGRMETDFKEFYRNNIRFKLQDTESYKRYWAPIASKLGASIQKLYFIPDGVYHELNVETLYDGSNYLFENTEIQLLGSSRDLLADSKPSSVALKRMALFGFPTFDLKGLPARKIDTGGQRFFDQDGRISELPGTKSEVEAISKLGSSKFSTQVYMNEKATEAAIHQVQGVDIMHIATHGYFIGRSSAKNQRIMGLDAVLLEGNPLLRSGLLLAGAQQTIQNGKFSGDDGILTAQEVLSMDLSQTQLVVMSACETGLGDIMNGEGVFGLQRAFRLAGARNVVMSLWKVDDEATNQLMVEFYRNLLIKGMTARESLNDAKMDLKQTFKNPFYWGAFILIGE